MNAGHSLLVVLAAAGILSGCATAQPPRSTSAAGDAPATSERAPTRLTYSAASAHTMQAMPAPGTCHYRGSGLYTQPDPRCGPGALNPAVTQANIEQTICRPGGYTASVRPPESVTEPEKRALMAAYDNTGALSDVELDHIISLGVGGASNDPRNLYPEPNYPHVSPTSYYQNPKDRLEERLHELVCAGRLSLTRAQTTLADEWPAAYRRYLR